MRIIEPYHVFMTPIDGEHGRNQLRLIEEAARTCYKSEGCITTDSAGPFVHKIASVKKHYSVIEHANVTIRFICDRGVTHEIVRHRIAAYSQESTRYCVAGSSKLCTANPHHHLTVEDFHSKKQASPNGAWKRIKIRQMNEATGALEMTKVSDIFSVGTRPTVLIKTRMGYSIELTEDHLVKSETGYVAAGSMHVGDKIAVNGTSLAYQNKDWMRTQFETLGKSATQVSSETGFNLSTVKKWVRKLGVRKLSPGHFNIGRVPWNRGMKEKDDVRVRSQANALRRFHWDSGPYTGLSKKDRVKKLTSTTYRKMVDGQCNICGSSKGLHVHHIDENRQNNAAGNLVTLCKRCHPRVHSKNLDVVFYDPIMSISPSRTQPVFDITVDSPHHNFVANGIVVHNCNYAKDKFGNEITLIRPFFFQEGTEDYEDWKKACQQAEDSYFAMIGRGRSPQEARSILPNSLKTEIVMTCNLRQWQHVLTLRCSAAAHPQMRQLMNPVLDHFKAHLPELFDHIQANA